jgi:dolichol-phosphate mannosyltransferase
VEVVRIRAESKGRGATGRGRTRGMNPVEPRSDAVPELSLIVPVFDEGDGIADLLLEWARVLRAEGLAFEIRAYDDGSRDRTPAELERAAAAIPELAVARHANRGHGPTILRGYREARGAWVFQADGDGEIEPAAFPRLWRERDGADLVLGRRAGRTGAPHRRLISAASRWATRALFGGVELDVNTPFRLMRRSCLQDLLAELPGDLFAPNVALTGLASRREAVIREVEVPHIGRRWGVASLGSWRLWRGVARAARETLGVAWRARTGR